MHLGFQNLDEQYMLFLSTDPGGVYSKGLSTVTVLLSICSHPTSTISDFGNRYVS